MILSTSKYGIFVDENKVKFSMFITFCYQQFLNIKKIINFWH